MERGYKRLEVYRRSYEAAKRIHGISGTFPPFERMEIGSQLRRAALSIPLNIAEGHSKNDSAKELNRFLRMAIGSANEVMVLLEFCRDFGYMEEEMYREFCGEYEQIAKMLQGLRKAIVSTND